MIAAIDSVNVELKELVVVLESVAPLLMLRSWMVLDPDSMVVEAVSDAVVVLQCR